MVMLSNTDSYTIDDLMILWKPRQPLMIARRLFLPLFRLESFDTEYYTIHTVNGEFNKLKANFIFQRRIKHYVCQYYLPSTMFVLTSWTGFYLQPNNISARVLLSMASLLSICVYVGHINDLVVKVSYSKSVDLWNTVCILFILSTLVLVVFVNYLFKNYGHYSLSARRHRKKEYLDEEIDLRVRVKLFIFLFIVLINYQPDTCHFV